MTLSSSTLFHFTKKMDTLLSILKDGFWPRYCVEKGWENRDIDFALPMVCFCDIPLAQISEHTAFYGKFGIGVSAEWTRKIKNLSPVQYISLGSALYNRVNRELTKLKNGKYDEIDYEYLSRAKKVSGKIKNEIAKDETKKYYDEREWRYIPDMPIQQLMVPVDKKFGCDTLKLSEQTKNMKLALEYDKIRYLIVPDEKARKKLIGELTNKMDLEQNQLYLLLSRIISLDLIKKDC